MAYQDKNPAIKNLLNVLTGTNVEKDIEEGTCPTCQKPVGPFKDELSRKEYRISGMCQSCQDSVFGG